MTAPLSEQQLAEIRRALRYTTRTASPDTVRTVAETAFHARAMEPNTPEWAAASELLIERTGSVLRRLLDAEARVGGLESERHSTNEVLDDAVAAIKAKDERIAEVEAERDQFADRVDTLTAVAKGNKQHVRTLMGDLSAAQSRIAELEKQAAAVAEFVAARAEYITAIRNCHPDNGHDYDRWQGHAESRRQLAETLGLPVAWPAEGGGPR